MKCAKCLNGDALDRVTVCGRCVQSLPIVLGLDLGQSQDHSALAGVRRLPLRERIFRRRFMYALVFLDEYELGVSYPAQVARVVDTLNRPQFKGGRCGVDYTGVGRPVFDLLKQARPQVILYPVLTTSGHAITHDPKTREYHVPKTEQVSFLQVLLQADLLNWHAKLATGAKLASQLAKYRVRITKAKNETFGAESGTNDDLVSAVMTACWLGEHVGTGDATGIGVPGEGQGSVVETAPAGVFATGRTV